MDIKKAGIEQLGAKIGNVGTPTATNPTANGKSSLGPSFEDTLQKLQQPHLNPQTMATPSAAFNSASGVKFSNHAVERMRSRGVSFSPNDLERISKAVEKAAAKGSKDSLVLMNDNALIVSVKNNTVVTVVDKNSLKENVFTNIDSTVVL